MPADLAALAPFVALLALAFWKPHWWQHTWEGPDGCTRRGRRPNVTGEDMDTYTLYDAEGEALPPWAGPWTDEAMAEALCPACDGTRGTPDEPCDECQGRGVR